MEQLNPMRIFTILVCLALTLCAPTVAWGGASTQTIELQPGWNAIHVEVEPDNRAIEQVFAGLPVASVWRWIPNDRSAGFIQDPDEELLTIDGWYGYFPPERSESVLTKDRKSTRLNSSHVASSYAVFCLKKKTARTASYGRFRSASGYCTSVLNNNDD